MKVEIILLVIGLVLARGQDEDGSDEEFTFECVEFIDNYCSKLSSTPGAPEIDVTDRFLFSFSAMKETHFYLFTKFNPVHYQEIKLNDADSVTQSSFDAKKPTKVVIHGYFNNKDSPVNKKITAAYLANYDVNVIVVDWGAGANHLVYNVAADRTKQVATAVAEFLDQLLDVDTRRWEQLTVVGHSLGAHIAGLTGKLVKNGKIGKIVGLDPAGPIFRKRGSHSRLHKTDANYVEVIHTNSRRLGIKSRLGTADFYPNRGKIQPNCGSAISCDIDSHSRSIDLFVESLTNNNFVAKQCPEDIDVSETDQFDNCQGRIAYFGGEPGNYNNLNLVNGIYYFSTNGRPSYGRGLIIPTTPFYMGGYYNNIPSFPNMRPNYVWNS